MRVGRDSIKGVGGKGGENRLFVLPNFSGFRNWDSLKWGELDNGLLNGCNVRGSASVFVQVVIINGSLILRLGFVMLVRLFDLSSGTICERLCLEFKELSRT